MAWQPANQIDGQRNTSQYIAVQDQEGPLRSEKPGGAAWPVARVVNTQISWSSHNAHFVASDAGNKPIAGDALLLCFLEVDVAVILIKQTVSAEPSTQLQVISTMQTRTCTQQSKEQMNYESSRCANPSRLRSFGN